MIARKYYPLLIAFVLTFIEAAQAQISMTIGQNFTASTYGLDSDAVPADANGAVGPEHFVEFVNGRFAVFTKQGGERIKTLTDRQFWINAGVDLPGNVDVTDPRTVF